MNPDEEDFHLLYFAVMKNSTSVTVVDLQSNMMYLRDDWNVISDDNFNDFDDAFLQAVKFASVVSCKYSVFESRYDSSSNQTLLSAAEVLLKWGVMLDLDVYDTASL